MKFTKSEVTVYTSIQILNIKKLILLLCVYFENKQLESKV
jgi:hypothetical protein